MLVRIRLAVGFALFLTLILTVPVLAGNWAVITVDQLPGEIVAGEPLKIGFTVLQHGRTPMAGLTPTITARLAGSNKSLVVNATAEGEVGHYTAQLTLPESGKWDWSIQAFSMDQSMPQLTVIAGIAQKTTQASTLSSIIPSWIMIGTFGVVVCLAGLVLAFRQRPRWAVPLLIGGLALGLFGFVSAQKVTPQAQALAAPNPSPVELGQQLFIAKGCTTCHLHGKINRSKNTLYVDIGPNLTNRVGASPDFVRAWIQNPTSIKPRTEMPNLKLSQIEIEALVAFLTTK